MRTAVSSRGLNSHGSIHVVQFFKGNFPLTDSPRRSLKMFFSFKHLHAGFLPTWFTRVCVPSLLLAEKP